MVSKSLPVLISTIFIPIKSPNLQNKSVNWGIVSDGGAEL
jgi:hypothetical protein